jgi:hypothetical protein
MKRSDLTEKLLDIKREKGWTWKHICEQIGGHSEVDRRRHSRPDETDQAAGGQCRKAVRPLQVEQAMINEVPMRGEGIQMPPTDPDLSLLRTGDGQRAGVESPDRGRIRRRHHVGDRFRHGHGASGESEG